MSFEELVEHIRSQHPDMKLEAIEEMAASILEEASTAYVGG
jgi:uncharacterized short protein YbdD (DUF466 family)